MLTARYVQYMYMSQVKVGKPTEGSLVQRVCTYVRFYSYVLFIIIISVIAIRS